MPGSFVLRPIEANITHSTDLLGKMSPYCSVNLGGQKFNGEVCKKGGKHPVWHNTITIPNANQGTITLDVLDKDLITKDDVIGSCSINLADFQARGHGQQWYPLFNKNKPAGEILLEGGFEGGFQGQGDLLGQQNMGMGMQSGLLNQNQTGLLNQNQSSLFNQKQTGLLNQNQNVLQTQSFVDNSGLLYGLGNQGHSHLESGAGTHIYHEQVSTVEPRTFTRNYDVVETVPVQKQVETTEPVKVLRDIEYTEAVPVMRTIETSEPQVVMKEIEVIEPRVINKTIQVIENVPVKRMVEIVEMKHHIQNVDSWEPQTFHKQVEVTEWVPVQKMVQVSEPVTVTKSVEFVENVITTQTVSKEIREPVIINERVTQEVGPATLIGQAESIRIHQKSDQWNEWGQWGAYSTLGENERRLRDEGLMKKEGWSKGLDLWRQQRHCSKHSSFECDQAGCYDRKLSRWI